MNLNCVKMRELESEKKEQPQIPQCTSIIDDGDTCDMEEIERIFGNSRPLSEKTIASNKYILQIAATSDNNPNVALNLSDNICEVYNLSNNQFAKLSVLTEHTDVISEIKFSTENSNLLYTGSNDGSVRLWDLRAPKKSAVQFKDSTVENQTYKQISCFDVSPNNILLAAGTNLFEADAFILFWDIRNHSFLGGYWESHTDDITQVKFHCDDSNKLISGSVDGLINLYDLSEPHEEDALIDSLNTESSIEKLGWMQQSRDDIITCITHTADVQFWRIDDAQPYYHLSRTEIAQQIKRKSEEYVYVVDVHSRLNEMFVVAGSNYQDGECCRGLSVVGNSASPAWGLPQNQQRVRASVYNPHTNLLLTGGEKGILNAWEIKPHEIRPNKKNKLQI